MGRLVFKIFVAFWTNLLGLYVVHSLLAPPHPLDEYDPPHFVTENWQPAATTMEKPGLVEGSTAADHPLSPFGLRAVISENPYGAELQPVWDWFGIKSALPPRCYRCTADVFQLELDAEPGVETVLRIGNRKTHYQYLVFKSSARASDPTGWKLLGYVDDITYRYEPPPHFTVAAGANKHWLVVQVRGASGESAVVYRNRVFEVTPKGVREVLSYPSSGYHVGTPGAPERSFDTLLLESVTDRREETLRVQFNSHYFRQGVRALSRQQHGLFVRRAGAERFVLDLRRSDLSGEELRAVYDSAALGNDDFLNYNFEELSRLAAEGDDADKEWLRLLLAECGETPRALALARLLRR